MDPQTPSVLTGRNSTKGIPASVKRTALGDFTQRLGRVYKPEANYPAHSLGHALTYYTGSGLSVFLRISPFLALSNAILQKYWTFGK